MKTTITISATNAPNTSPIWRRYNDRNAPAVRQANKLSMHLHLVAEESPAENPKDSHDYDGDSADPKETRGKSLAH
jgi:hypothetical protein